MSFDPMNIPPGSGPSLEGKPGQKWFQRRILWVLVAVVIIGALFQILG